MAIAAWSANVVANSICFSVNGRTSERVKAKTPIGAPSRASEHQGPSGSRRAAALRSRISFYVGNMNDFSFKDSASEDRAALRYDWNTTDVIYEFGGESVVRCAIEYIPLLPRNACTVGIAKFGGRFDERL